MNDSSFRIFFHNFCGLGEVMGVEKNALRMSKSLSTYVI